MTEGKGAGGGQTWSNTGGSGGSYKPSSVGGKAGSNREVASAGGASRGPASDVQGKYGPSLFAMGTQVIAEHCKAGKFLNCP